MNESFITDNKFELIRQININPTKQHVIESQIQEFDIQAAHPSALYFIKGKDLYDELMAMDKQARNEKVGLMLRNNKDLSDKIAAKILEWTNLFIQANNIRANQFLESTKDSIMIYNKIPKYTTFENGIVNFRNKDGEFSSYHRIKNRYTILYDNGAGTTSKRIKIKGVNDAFVDSSKFVKKHLIKILHSLETSITQSKSLAVNRVKNEIKAIKSMANSGSKSEEDLCIFRELANRNQYKYYTESATEGKYDIIYSDVVIDDEKFILDTSDNYKNFVTPLVAVLFS